jgi:hypothetical protein
MLCGIKICTSQGNKTKHNTDWMCTLTNKQCNPYNEAQIRSQCTTRRTNKRNAPVRLFQLPLLLECGGHLGCRVQSEPGHLHPHPPQVQVLVRQQLQCNTNTQQPEGGEEREKIGIKQTKTRGQQDKIKQYKNG